jgi:outer membrane protein TolC
MLRFLRPIALVLTLGCLVSHGRAQAPEPVSVPLPEAFFPGLKEIIAAAIKQSPRMISRNLDNAMSEQDRIAARAGQLPTVSGYLQYNPWERDYRADETGPLKTQQLLYGLTLTQPVYHWGELKANTRIGELRLTITRGQTAEAYRLLVQEIRSRYLAVIMTKAGLARAQLNLAFARDQLAVAQEKYDKKVFSDADMFVPRMTTDQSVLAADRAAEDYRVAKRTLAKLSGTAVLEDSQVPDEIPSVTAPQDRLEAMMNAYVSQKDPKSYALDNLRTQLEVEKLNYKVATTRLKPKLNFLMGATQDEQSYTADISTRYKLQTYYAGIQVSWSIFDGFATRSALNSSLLRRRQMEQGFEDATTNQLDDVRSEFKQLGFAARAMELADRQLGSAEAGLHLKQDDLKRGLASESEVSAAQLGYSFAQITAFNARADYLTRTSEFLSTMIEDPALASLPGHTP